MIDLNEENNLKIIKWIKQKKEEYNISYKEISHVSKISVSTLKRILNSKISRSHYDILKLKEIIKDLIKSKQIFPVKFSIDNKKIDKIQIYKKILTKNYYINRYIKSIIFSLSIFEEINNYLDFFKTVLPLYEKNISFFEKSISILKSNKIIQISDNILKKGINFVNCTLNNVEKSRLINSFINYFEKKIIIIILLIYV